MITLKERVELEKLFRACGLARDELLRCETDEALANNEQAIKKLNEFLDGITQKEDDVTRRSNQQRPSGPEPVSPPSAGHEQPGRDPVVLDEGDDAGVRA